MKKFQITIIETNEKVYYVNAKTEDEALKLLKTEIYDHDIYFLNEELKSIVLDEGDK